MIKAISSLLVIVLAVSSQDNTFIEPPSPCPNVFKYVPPGTDDTPVPGTEKWYGIINLTTDETLYALFLNVILDKKADILGNWIGEVTTTDNLNFKIENTKMKLAPDVPLAVRFFIQYNVKSPVPKLRTILFNGKEICSVDNPVISEQKIVSKSINYDLNKGSFIQTDNIMKMAHSTTERSTKNIYDRYQTNSSNNRVTTIKSTWTQQQEATTESISRVGTIKSENKASIDWGSTQTKPGNNIRIKTIDNQQIKHEKQSISKNNSQSQSQSWSQTSLKDDQQTDNKIVKTENNELSFQLPISKTWAAKSQHTTEKEVQAVYSSTLNSKPRPEKTPVVITDNNPKLVTGSEIDSQLWSQISVVPNNENAGSNEDQISRSNLQKNTADIQDWSPTNNENKEQTRREGTTVVNIANPNYDTETNAKNFHIREDTRQNDGRIEVIPQASPISTTPQTFEWPQRQPERVSEATPSQYADNYSGSNHDNRNLPSSKRVQQTTEKPYSVYEAPIIDDYVIDNPTSQTEGGYFSGGIPTVFIPNQKPELSCGKVTKSPPAYLPPGSTTSEGQWPWQAALYQQQTVDFKYICGGTLVSYRHVITAAHCVARKNSKRKVNNNTLTVYLGKFNLRTSVDGVQIKFVKNIIIHPDYNPMTLGRDLAILELREPVRYTDYVRPACLWPENETGLRSIIGKRGSVVGWSSEVTGASKEELNLIEMPVVAQDICINSYLAFYEKFTSDYTYCAGYGVGTSVCHGDSGGGMVFKKGTNWYLRGLASISVARSNEYRCDPSQYVIFTDIAKFLPWVEENID